MQKRSHLLLARTLLSRGRVLPARRHALAFLLGSFQPDCNPLSYLKGSLRGKAFGGHTYANARPYIDRRIRRLQARQRRNLWDWYTLGKLTHYVADAFTWAHNPRFPGAAWEHHAYETRLRVALEARLSAPLSATPDAPSPDGRRPVPDVSATPDAFSSSDAAPLPDVSASLATLHERYLAEARPGVDTDISYILRASEWLMTQCRPASERLMTERCPASAALGNFA